MHPVNQTTREVKKLKTQSTRVSSHSSPYGSSLLDRQGIYGREQDDPVDGLDVNMAIWSIFLNTTLQAAVHLGQECEANLRFVKNHLWNSVGQLFNANEKLISEQTEITGVSTVGFKELTWLSTSLLCSRAYQITNAKTCVFSDSVLCAGKNGMWSYCDREEQNWMVFWQESLQGYESNRRYADGVREENIPRIHNVRPLRGDSKTYSVNLSTSKTRSSSWIQFTDRCELCSQIPSRSLVFRNLHWQTRRILGQSCREHDDEFSQIPVIQYFVLPVPLREENWEAKSMARSQYTFNGSDENIELLLRTVISENQLSIYGATADLCNEVPKGIRGNLQHRMIWKRWKFLPTYLLQNILPMHSNGDTWCKNTNENSNSCQKTRNYPNYVLMRVWRLSKHDNTSTLLIQKKDNRCNIYAENTRCLAMKRELVWVDGFSRTRESVQSWTWKFAVAMTDTVSKSKFHLCFKTIPPLGSESWTALTSTWQNRC